MCTLLRSLADAICRLPDGLLPAGVRRDEGTRPVCQQRPRCQVEPGQEPTEAVRGPPGQADSPDLRRAARRGGHFPAAISDSGGSDALVKGCEGARRGVARTITYCSKNKADVITYILYKLVRNCATEISYAEIMLFLRYIYQLVRNCATAINYSRKIMLLQWYINKLVRSCPTASSYCSDNATFVKVHICKLVRNC